MNSKHKSLYVHPFAYTSTNDNQRKHYGLGYHVAYWRQHAAPNSGPGDCLHRAILRWVGQSPEKSCGCENRIAQMNEWEVDGCRANLDRIVFWLLEQARRRGWLLRLAASMPGAKIIIRKMVSDAIDESERLYLESKPPVFRAFYHIACLGNWREVFREQADLFASVGILPTAYVLGSEADAAHVATRMHVAGRHDSMAQFETPTLQMLWEWCRNNPAGVALYAHTKGVSKPRDPRRVAWRQLMGEYVIRDWRENVRLLDSVDAVGVSWLPRGVHFSGNFFMARADWINRLPSPNDHRNKERPANDNGAWDRLGCELWLGSRPGIRVHSYCGSSWLASGRKVFVLLAQKRGERVAPNAGRPLHAQPNRSGPVPLIQAVGYDAVLRRIRANPRSSLVRRLAQ